MARTAITVNTVTKFLTSTNLSGTAGDAGNDHSLSLLNAPNLLLLVSNKNASTVAFTIELPAGASNFNVAESKAYTIPAAAASVEGKLAIWLNVPSDLFQSGSVLHIDSADANFADVTFYGIRWA